MKIWRLKQQYKYILITFLIVTCVILFVKPECLLIPVFDNSSFPLGTIFSWLALILFSMVMCLFVSSKVDNPLERYVKTLVQLCLVMALFWGVVSFLLSGNWAFNFKNATNFYIWIFYTGLIVFIPIIILLFKGIHFLFNRKR